MATKILNTRIKNRFDTLGEWQKEGVELLAGEIALVKVETQQIDPATGNVITVPAVLMKVGEAVKDGDGNVTGHKSFSALPWVSALASDVYDWAKSQYAKDIPVSVVKGTDTTATSSTLGAWLKTVYDAGVTNASNIASVTATANTLAAGESTTGSVAAKIKAAIDALDVSDTAVAGQFVTKVTEANGKITVTRAALAESDIPSLAASKIKTGTSETLDTKLGNIDQDIADLKARNNGHTDTQINTLITNKINALDVSAPSASGTATSFISSVSQTDGKISATKANLPTANSSTAGIVKLGATGGAATYDAVNTLTGTTIPGLEGRIAANEGKLTDVSTTVGAAISTAINALDVSEPSASGTSTSFIATAKQTDGKIVVTKKNLPTASSSTAGIAKLGATGGAATYDSIFGTNGLSADVAKNASDIAAISTAIAGGVHFVGSVTAAPTGTTTSVNGHTIHAGDIVLYSGKEYICTGVSDSKPTWELLGDASRIGDLETKINNLDYSTTNAVATTHKFASQVTQTDGKIAVTYTQPAATDVSYGDSTVSAKLGAIDAALAEKADEGHTHNYAASSHAHGNITNSGTITSTAVTAATGVLVYDSNNKIQRATAANARAIIGAGTSSLTIGTTSTTAAAGNHTHSGYESRIAANEAKLDDVDSTVGASITAAIQALDATDPTASGTTTSFIATVSQTDGKITATKKTVTSASTSTAGIVKLSTSTSSTSTSLAATPSAVKSAYDKAVDAQSRVGAVEAKYMWVDTTTDKMYLGSNTTDYIIFDCGGAV